VFCWQKGRVSALFDSVWIATASHIMMRKELLKWSHHHKGIDREIICTYYVLIL